MSKPLGLIIEDSQDVAELYCLALASSGFETEIIGTGEDALVRLAASEPEIVLLDLQLSQQISGADILHYIRSNPRLAQTRVIVITGYAAMAETMEPAADLVLIKPVNINLVLDFVERLIMPEAGA